MQLDAEINGITDILRNEGSNLLKSMTGYGRGESLGENYSVTLEMKSVNHRFLEISIRLPKQLNPLEDHLKHVIQSCLSRGKVDVYISYQDHSVGQAAIRYNATLAGEYLAHLRQMKADFVLPDDITVTTLSRYPEVLVMEEQALDEEMLWQDLKTTIEGACGHFVNARMIEGENLLADILGKLDSIELLSFEVEKRSPAIIEAYRNKLTEKVKTVLEDKQIDEARLITEVVLFADRISTDEEVVRLKSHVNQMQTALHEKEGVGRKLDFIAQEMNREANTILSKANDMEVSNFAIHLKTEIEKIREQIQNIE